MNRHRDTQPDKEREWRREEKGGGGGGEGRSKKKQDSKKDESRLIPWFGKKTEQMASTINQP